MKLPIKIEIQIVDRSGKSNPLANVVLGLKIYLQDDSWYNYSIFKTNADGYIVLTRQDIIDNTEIKHGGYVESNEPTKFKLYVWDGPLINNLINSTKNLLDLYADKELIRKNLLEKGFAEENIPAAINSAIANSNKDMVFYEKIKDAINGRIQIYTGEIEDIWVEDLPKQYQFVIE